MWPRLRCRKIVSELFCTPIDIYFSYMLLLKECFDDTRHCYFCIFTILKTSHVLAANAIGDCTGDSFVVSGTNNNVPIICGENSGQHSKYQKLKLYNSLGNFILFRKCAFSKKMHNSFHIFSFPWYGRRMCHFAFQPR